MGWGGVLVLVQAQSERYSSEGEDSGLPIPSQQGPLPLEESRSELESQLHPLQSLGHVTVR